jgi:salicylate hydroxylase
MMALAGREVTVIGAGVAGLATARALALRGARVTVLEQAAGLEDVGAGLQISPNGAAVIRALGLGAALDAASLGNGAVVLRNAAGAQLLRMDLAGRDYRLLHRADLIDLLATGARAAGAALHFGVAADAAQGALVVGADGVKSQVRAALNGRVAPFFTRQVAWRAVIVGDGGPVEAEVFMAPGRHLVSYPLRGGAFRNIVAVEERGDWAAEGWSHRDDPANLRAAFAGFGPRVRGWLDQIGEVGLWGLFRHPVAPRWHEGRRVLVGDAAHPTLPFLAQGANMALEDAWVLAAELARRDDPAAAFAAYQAARLPRVARIVAAANRNARVYHAGGLRRLGLQAAFRAAALLAPAAPLRRFDWLYGEDVTQGAPGIFLSAQISHGGPGV